MKRRKRAPGGGRRPQGDFSRLTVPFSVRMPATMRDELKRAAQERGRTEGQELLGRLQGSFNREREKGRDPALRAFCFLFSELARVICVNMELQPDWRFDPWLFHTVKLAIGKLLDRFEPSGEMKLPVFWQFARDAKVDEGLRTKEERARITQSPEAMADAAVQKVLLDFTDRRRLEELQQRLKSLVGVQDDEAISDEEKQLIGYMTKEWETTNYGMGQAQRDLGKPESQGGKS
jgi:hypothetical protein